MGVTANLRAALLAADTGLGLAADLNRAWRRHEGHSLWSGGPQHSPLTPRFALDSSDTGPAPNSQPQRFLLQPSALEMLGWANKVACRY